MRQAACCHGKIDYWIDDSSYLTPTMLRSRVRKSVRQFGHPALILVDYLQLMRSPGQENRTLEIAEISRALKSLAKEMRCPVVALSQLNRDLENAPTSGLPITATCVILAHWSRMPT